jgi:formylglycine-generating enzyme required for sulfatase activity
VVGVSWYECAAYCKWLTAAYQAQGERTVIRLATEVEWEKVARGTDGLIYPYGNEFDRLKGNAGATGIGRTSAAGIFVDGASLYQVLDMSGNVWEWVSSRYRDYPYQADDGREDSDGTDVRVLRGGSWNNINADFFRCDYRIRGSPRFRSLSVGLRLASSL